MQFCCTLNLTITGSMVTLNSTLYMVYKLVGLSCLEFFDPITKLLQLVICLFTL